METPQDHHTCIECDTNFQGFYCPNCGLKHNEGRITAKTQFQEFIISILNVEKFFFKTTVSFIVRPGKAALEYLKGKRTKYHRPIAFVVVWITVYLIIHTLITESFDYEYVLINPDTLTANAEAKKWMYSHPMIILFLSLIIVAFPCYLVIGVPANLNYFEVLTLSMYGEGCLSLYMSVQDLLGGVLFGLNINHEIAYLTIFMVAGIYNAWFCYDLMRRLKLRYLWPRLIVASLLVIAINKFSFDYLSLIIIKLLE